MDRASLKEHARKQLQGKIFTLFAMYLIVFVATTAVSYLAIGFGFIVSLLISGPIAFAWAMIYLGITKKSRMPLFDDLISGFKGDNFSRNFMANLYYTIFVFLWSLLFIIPGIIKSIAYSQMFYFLAEDGKIDAATAMKKSMKIMEGHKWEYFILQLSFIPWHLLGFITLGLAYIWVGPYINATMAEYHVRLVGNDKTTQSSTKKVSAKNSSQK